jgi:hypothetical protein
MKWIISVPMYHQLSNSGFTVTPLSDGNIEAYIPQWGTDKVFRISGEYIIEWKIGRGWQYWNQCDLAKIQTYKQNSYTNLMNGITKNEPFVPLYEAFHKVMDRALNACRQIEWRRTQSQGR